jgi:hypothetical protein
MRFRTKPMIRAAVAHSGDILLKRKEAGKPNKNPTPPEKAENLENVPSEEFLISTNRENWGYRGLL